MLDKNSSILLKKNLGRLFDIYQEADRIVHSFPMEKRPGQDALDIAPSAEVERISLYPFAEKVLGDVIHPRNLMTSVQEAKDLTCL